jgi:hypothetical protein
VTDVGVVLALLQNLRYLLDHPLDPLLHYCAARTGRLNVEKRLIEIVGPLAAPVWQTDLLPVVNALVQQRDVAARRWDASVSDVHLAFDQSSGCYQTSGVAV